MNLEVFSLCDIAAIDKAGKLSVIGAFDTIWADTVPISYPQCAVALRIRFEGLERGEHKVVVNFVDIDGHHIVQPASGTISINFPDDQRSASANLVLNLQMLKLGSYGEYSIDLLIDEQNAGSLPLFVKPIAQLQKAKE